MVNMDGQKTNERDTAVWMHDGSITAENRFGPETALVLRCEDKGENDAWIL